MRLRISCQLYLYIFTDNRSVEGVNSCLATVIDNVLASSMFELFTANAVHNYVFYGFCATLVGSKLLTFKIYFINLELAC